jgi:two-component system, LuxR family, sensor kinase FixL
MISDAIAGAHRAEDAEAELFALMEAAVDAIVVIEEDGTILCFSRAAEKMFGYAAADVLGQPVTALMPEPYRNEHAGYVDHYLKTGEPHIIGIGRQVDAVRSDGTVFPVWLSVGEAVTGSGRRFVGILHDLTEQQAAELERHALEARLAHVSRLSLLGEMTAGVAHEINQPLSAISNYARAAKNLMEHTDRDEDSLKAACSGISEQVQRAGAVIENLRKFVRKREIRKDPLRLREIIEGVLVLVRADATHAGVAVRTELADDLPEVLGNAVQLQQVLLNLTRNAVDAMSGMKTRAKQMLIQTRRGPNATVQVLVCDRGPGVSSSLEDAIFHPFFTTKQDGLGVGLAISRSIVESHGGELTYEDRPGGGAVFIVSLPELERA